jgi:hypothetical protein
LCALSKDSFANQIKKDKSEKFYDNIIDDNDYRVVYYDLNTNSGLAAGGCTDHNGWNCEHVTCPGLSFAAVVNALTSNSGSCKLDFLSTPGTCSGLSRRVLLI